MKFPFQPAEFYRQSPALFPELTELKRGRIFCSKDSKRVPYLVVYNQETDCLLVVSSLFIDQYLVLGYKKLRTLRSSNLLKAAQECRKIFKVEDKLVLAITPSELERWKAGIF